MSVLRRTWRFERKRHGREKDPDTSLLLQGGPARLKEICTDFRVPDAQPRPPTTRTESGTRGAPLRSCTRLHNDVPVCA